MKTVSYRSKVADSTTTPLDRPFRHPRFNTLAIPVAEDVVIIGEAIVNGTLKGSYRYVNDAENPEGDSRFRWTVDDQQVSTELELHIPWEYEGSSVVFHVTPIARDGEIGATVSSEAKIVESGFQFISDEENQNSFPKQIGNWSFYTPEPSDRIFVSTGGAFSCIDAPTQSVFVHGKEDYGERVPPEIKTYLHNNPATVMFSTLRDFAALVPLGATNQLLVWGVNMPRAPDPDVAKRRNIRSVYSNRGAFVYIYKSMSSDNKWIGAVGDANHGGTVPDDIHLKLVNDPPVAVYATLTAFAVRTKAGKVYAWGNRNEGGEISKDAQALLQRQNTSRIIANATAFCAIDDSGSFVTWGNAANGGTIPADKLETILDQGGVKSVIASRAAFCAITKGRAKAVSWGHAQYGGNMTAGAAELAARGNIVLCKAATWAFCMVNAQGQADAWGVANSGGTIPNADLPQDERDYQPVDVGCLMAGSGSAREIRRLFLEKMISAGVDIHDQDAVESAANALSDQVKSVGPKIIVEDGEVSIYANDSSFFLIALDEYGFSNQVLAWGQANGGGQLTADARQALMASQIKSVYCTNGAYGVICTQGRTEGVVVVWGATLAQMDAGEIPKSPPEIAEKLAGGIIELYSIKREPPVDPTPVRVDPSFAARHKDGSYVLWGGNVENQVYIPEPTDDMRRSLLKRSLAHKAEQASTREDQVSGNRPNHA